MSPAYQQGAALSQSLDNKGRRSTIAQAGVFPLTRATSAGVCRCDLPPRHLSSSSLVVGKFSPKEWSVHHGFLPSISHWLPRLPVPTPSSYGPPPRPRAKQNKTKPTLTAVLTRKRATVAEATGAGRWGEGLQGHTVLLLRAARLDRTQVAVAAGAEVARQRQVKCLRRCRLRFAAGGLAGRLILVAEVGLAYLSRQRQASGASFTHPRGPGTWKSSQLQGCRVYGAATQPPPAPHSVYGMGDGALKKHTAPLTVLGFTFLTSRMEEKQLRIVSRILTRFFLVCP